jgi:hypothetical protein
MKKVLAYIFYLLSLTGVKALLYLTDAPSECKIAGCPNIAYIGIPILIILFFFIGRKLHSSYNREEKLFIHALEVIDGLKEREFDKNGDHVVVWPVSELEKMNKQYEAHTYAPHFILIGTNGGGEAYAWQKKTGKIYMLPFIGMNEKDVVFKANSLEEFLK